MWRVLVSGASGRRGRGWVGRFFLGVVGVVGYLLSPLSPWNDAVVNVPIAYCVARFLSMLGIPFPVGFYVGYVASNVAGMLLLAFSVEAVRRERVLPDRRKLGRMLLVSALYSVTVYLVLYLLG